MTRALLAVGLAAGLVLAATPGATAQSSPERTTTVPLPNGTGTFYYRAGSVGGVRIRQRPAPPDTLAAPAPPPPGISPDALALALRDALADLRSDRGGAGTPAVGANPADLARLEAAVRRLEGRLDDLSTLLLLGDRNPRRPVSPITEPSQRVPVIPLTPKRDDRADDPPADRPEDRLPPVTPVIPRTPRPDVPPVQPSERVELGPVTVEEVERAILETGLFRTSRVPFEFGEAALLPEAERVLGAVADVLSRYPALRVEVGGHTDAISSDAFNLRLSADRAASVQAYLVSRGIAPDRLEAVGYGEAMPIATNETETGRALNRRVEFVVLNPEAAVQERQTTRPAEDELRQRLREILREELRREEEQY